MADSRKIDFMLSATDRASPIFRGVQSSMERLQGSYSSLVAIMGGAGVAGALLLSTKHAIEAGDQLNKMSQKVGISVSALSELKFGAQLADVGIDSLGTGLKKFNGALVDASNPTSKMAAIFNSLGVDVRAGPVEAFKQFATAVSRLEDGELKTALATEVLGRNGMELIPMLNAGRKGMDAAAESARKLGLVMSEQTAKSAEELNDNLKKLNTGGQALGMTLATKIAGGLASVTEHLVKAKEEGNLLLGVFKEMAKVNLALFSKIPGPIGALAGAGAERLFDESGSNGALNGPVYGRIRGASQAGTQVVDQAALRKALSGQKDSGKAAKDRTAEYERLARLLVEGEEAAAREVTEAWKAWEDIQLNNHKVMTDAWALQWKQVLDEIDAEQERSIADGKAYLDALAKEAKKTKDFMADLGFTMVSAFEDAIVKGKEFSTVLQGLLQDIAKYILRKKVLDPLGNAAGDWLSNTFGGGSQPQPLNSYATGTDYVPRTGLYQLHQGEKVTPAGENGGGHTINITVNADSSTKGNEVAAALLPVMRGLIRSEITTQLRPGGALQGT